MSANSNTDKDTATPSPRIIDGINTEEGLIAWFARNSVAANLLMFFILALGLFSVFSIQRAIMPEVELNVISIETPYPGASPQEVERGVALKIEESLKDIDGIEKISAVSLESFAMINIDVLKNFEFNTVMDEVKVAVDGITSFPEEVEKPVIKEMQWRQFALNLQVYGTLSESEMKLLVDEIKNELQQDPVIGYVETMGARPYEIAIEIKARDLRQYNLTLEQVAQKIRQSSLDMPGGSIKTANGDILLRTRGQAYHQQDFEQVVLITRPDGTRLTLADIATISDGFEEGNGFAFFDGYYSIGLTLFTSPGQDIIEVAEAGKSYILEKQQTLPEGVYLDYWADVTYYLEERIGMMLKNLGLGALLVLVVLTLFLDMKLAFWVMLGLPICFLGTFAILPMEGIGVSLNMFSLFGFILVLGIVVDDAIIIGESAGRYTEQYGHSIDAVVAGAKRVAVPATFGVLTTIVAFLPTLLTNTRISSIPEAFGWVVILCLIFSLVESKWILPAHLAHSRPATSGPLLKLQPLQRFTNKHLLRFIEAYYVPLVNHAIKWRYITGASFVGILIITVGLISGGLIRVVIMPAVQSDFIEAKLEMAEGSSDEQTVEAFLQLYQALRETDEELSESGQNVISHTFAYAYGGRNVHTMVELTKNTKRTISSDEIAVLWREKTGALPGAKVLAISSAEDDFGEAISLRLVGNNEKELSAAASELTAHLSTYDGLYDFRNGAETAQDEIVLSLEPSAEAAGISLAKLATQVRHAFYGAEAQRVQRGTDEVKVMVRYPRAERDEITNLQDMYVYSDANEFVPLSSIAKTIVQPGYAQLQRINGERSIPITAEADKDVAEPQSIVQDLNDNFFPELKRKYPSVDYRKGGQTEDTETLNYELITGFGFAMIGVYALLAIPLRSYTQPLIIMSVIPFGLIGAFVGHLVLGQAFSMMSFMGIIALTGVVVNDSLIMVDFINRKLTEGTAVMEAIVAAGRERFRPILLTSLTTFVGLSPMLLEKSVQAKIIQPMAISLSFGILFSTVITVILVPCLYAIREDLRGNKSILNADDSNPVAAD